MIWLVLWLACGFYASGVYYAYFQRQWPTIADEERPEDTGGAVIFVLLGPIGALISTFMSGFLKHGWLLPGRKP